MFSLPLYRLRLLKHRHSSNSLQTCIFALHERNAHNPHGVFVYFTSSPFHPLVFWSTLRVSKCPLSQAIVRFLMLWVRTFNDVVAAFSQVVWKVQYFDWIECFHFHQFDKYAKRRKERRREKGNKRVLCPPSVPGWSPVCEGLISNGSESAFLFFSSVPLRLWTFVNECLHVLKAY